MIYTDSITGLPQPGLDASREGRRIFGYVNGISGLGTEAVLLNTTFLKAVPVGSRLVITSFHMALSTADDDVTVEFVGTETDAGAGAVTILSQTFQIASGVQAPMAFFDPPIVVNRDVAHAFSARVESNDQSATIYLGYYGWIERDV